MQPSVQARIPVVKYMPLRSPGLTQAWLGLSSVSERVGGERGRQWAIIRGHAYSSASPGWWLAHRQGVEQAGVWDSPQIAQKPGLGQYIRPILYLIPLAGQR